MNSYFESKSFQADLKNTQEILLKYQDTHPNICNLWRDKLHTQLHQLHNTIQKINSLNKDLTNFPQDIPKHTIAALYILFGKPKELSF